MRLGHRPERDKRITTHVGLVARAFGASGMLLASEDVKIKKSLAEVTERWGGSFYVRICENWRAELRRWKSEGGKICHLTMYGINLPEVIEEIRREARRSKLMVVVGAEKVPFEVYELADWNVAVGNQPHSEVAALAVFLDWLFEGKELYKKFEGGELEIIPSARGKKVVRKSDY
ncbi:MAG TPA: tRNA (cytidine(56)-2'-O)-methyltransferase [Methanomicrobia archaeon]|nr:tRNA (cytidine(56)-2'-O)-methyltransferase [Methanomicrobia archaeon]HEX58837.1 tRNA (cytidine(56)-2'-O)-methyltransferase [Methanomicrobia archaeon]